MSTNSMTPAADKVDLPALGPDTFDWVIELLKKRRLPDTVTEIEAMPGGPLLEDASLTVAGVPTRWGRLDSDPDVSFPFGRIPCSVTWCVGHDIDESERWDGLTHQTTDAHVSGPGTYGAYVTTVQDRKGARVNVSIHCDGDFDALETVDLWSSLSQTSAAIFSAVNFAEQLRFEQLRSEQVDS